MRKPFRFWVFTVMAAFLLLGQVSYASSVGVEVSSTQYESTYINPGGGLIPHVTELTFPKYIDKNTYLASLYDGVIDDLINISADTGDPLQQNKTVIINPAYISHTGLAKYRCIKDSHTWHGNIPSALI